MITEAEIERIKRLDKELSKFSNYVGFDTGNKFTKGKDTGIFAFRVFVTKKKGLPELHRLAVIPEMLEGLPTDVIPLGEVKALMLLKKKKSLWMKIKEFVRHYI